MAEAKGTICMLLFLMISLDTSGQADNYWSWNFNTPSTLLAGAVVGGSAGSTAIFYNPSLIDHDNIPTLSLSASIVTLQFFSVENLAGNGIDIRNNSLRIQPRFLSYNLPSKNERLGIELAVLSPVSEDIQYTIPYTSELDIIQRTIGPEIYSGYLQYRRNFDDTWIGAGTSYRLSENFYVGGSAFVSVKLFKYQYRTKAQAFQDIDSVQVDFNTEPMYIASNSFEEEMKYWYVSMILKLGGQYKSPGEQFSLGFNITFPGIPFFGRADIRKSFDRSNIYYNALNRFNANEIFLETIRKEKVRIKDPFSAAIGGQYFSKNKKNTILFTLEYFHRIDPYAIVSPEYNGDIPSFMQGSIQQEDIMSYYYEARSLSNIAIGFRKQFSPEFSFLGGFRTDFTNATANNTRFIEGKFKFNQIHLDKYHITGGSVFEFNQKFRVIAGVQYSFGRKRDFHQLVNFSEPLEYIPESSQALEGIRLQNANAMLNEIALFFGMIVDFSKN